MPIVEILSETMRFDDEHVRLPPPFLKAVYSTVAEFDETIPDQVYFKGLGFPSAEHDKFI